MVPNIELESILLLGYRALYKECNLTGFNHKKKKRFSNILSCQGPVETMEEEGRVLGGSGGLSKWVNNGGKSGYYLGSRGYQPTY